MPANTSATAYADTPSYHGAGGLAAAGANRTDLPATGPASDDFPVGRRWADGDHLTRSEGDEHDRYAADRRLRDLAGTDGGAAA